MTAAQALRSPQFIVLAATYFCCCATHSGPIFHTVSYAIACGLPVMAAVTIYSVEGVAGLGGRVLFGLAGDRFGAKRVLVIGLFAQALGAGAYFFVRQLGEFYAVAAIFGLIYGGVMPLYAVIAREYFPMRLMGTVFGASTVFLQPRHGAGARGRRLDLRHDRQLRLALYRLLRHRLGRHSDRPRLPALPVPPAGRATGGIGCDPARRCAATLG